MKTKKKKIDISIISFNAMGLFNFDSLHGIIASRNIIKRLTKTAEVLKKKDADIILFQEVHTYSALKLLRTKLSDYPYIIYKRLFYGPKGGLVIFSKLPIEKTEYIDFTKRGSFRNKSFYAHIIRNGVLSCKIKKVPVFVMNIYMTANTDQDWSVTNRFATYIEAQLKQIAQIIKEVSEKKCDIIIGGDFNTAKDSYFYDMFVQLAQVKDIFTNFNFPTQHKGYLPKHQERKRIDYIFLFNQYAQTTIESAKHLLTEKITFTNGKSSYLSDHIALNTKLSFLFSEELFEEFSQIKPYKNSLI